MQFTDHYRVPSLQSGAGDIKSAFRRPACKSRPDVSQERDPGEPQAKSSARTLRHTTPARRAADHAPDQARRAGERLTSPSAREAGFDFSALRDAGTSDSCAYSSGSESGRSTSVRARANSSQECASCRLGRPAFARSQAVRTHGFRIDQPRRTRDIRLRLGMRA